LHNDVKKAEEALDRAFDDFQIYPLRICRNARVGKR